MKNATTGGEDENDVECASSVEAVRATDQDEEHNPVTLKQCRSTQCKLLLVITHSHSPPACVCAVHCCLLWTLCIFVMCRKMETQSLLWRGAVFGGAHWMRVLCGHLRLSEQQAYDHVPARCEESSHHISYFQGSLRSHIISEMAILSTCY